MGPARDLPSLLGLSFCHRNRSLAYLVGDGKAQLNRGCSSGIIPPPRGNVLQSPFYCSLFRNGLRNRTMGRGLLLWLLGIPIPVIILLYVFHIV